MWAEIPNSPPMGTPCELIVTMRNIQGDALTDAFERRHPRTIDGVSTTLPEPTSIPISPVRRRLAGGRHRAHGRQRHAAAY